MPWNRSKLLKAYQLQNWESEFVRMIQIAQKQKALRKSAAQDFPLSQYQRSGGATVERMTPGVLQGNQASAYDQAPLLGAYEQRQRKAGGA